MYVTVDPVESYLLLGLVKRRYVRIFMNSQPIQHIIDTRQFPYYKALKEWSKYIKWTNRKTRPIPINALIYDALPRIRVISSLWH